MKLTVISVGKDTDSNLDQAIKYYQVKILRYFPIDFLYIDHMSSKEKEGEKILSYIKKEDYVILLDEKGTEIKSENFAEIIENRMVDGARRIVFIIGGAYGVSKDVETRANYTWKLSSLVFPHMLVRVILLEQIYRAFTIIRGEKYHHGDRVVRF